MWQDLRFGIRSLAKEPGFAAVAIIALALGIGANATVFSMVNAIMFKPLPFPESDRILYLSSQNPKDGPAGISPPEYEDLRVHLKSLSGLAAASRDRVNLSDDVNAPDGYLRAQITPGTFTALGLPPTLGRDFNPGDATPGAPPVIILTHVLWQKRYGGDPSVVGKKIRLNSVPGTIIGVAAPDVSIPAETELWSPYIPDPKATRQSRYLTVFGKPAPGISRTAVQSEASLLAQRFAAQYPETNKDIRYRVQSFTEQNLRGPIKSVFLVLLVAVGFVLLIACANVANLLLSRAVRRAREVAIRTALGAGRWRLVRQLFVESLLLAFAGGLIGLAIARWGIRAFDTAVSVTGKPAWIDFSMDYRAFVYLAGITAVTAILFGLVPALRLSRVDLNSTIKDGGRAGVAMHGRFLSGVLVVVEMTLAVVLLIGAGLMIRSFLAMYARDMHVETANVLTLRVELPKAKYATPAAQLDFPRRLAERLRAIGGVQAASVASGPLGGGNLTFPYEVEGQPPDPEHQKSTNLLLAGEQYFETLQLAASRGRVLAHADYVAGPPVAVINQALARRLWPQEDPVGKRLRFFRNTHPTEWTTVIGVVPDFLQAGMSSDLNTVAILPFRQEPRPFVTVLARTRVNAASLANTFRREIQALDPDLPVRDVMTLDDQLALSRWPLRVFGAMFTVFAAMALLLATVGLYAVMAYGVNLRTQEIGIRVALGASGGRILRMIFSTGIWQASIGLSLGLVFAFAVSRVLGAILVVSPTDPLTFAIVAFILMSAAILGCTLPAHRATRVDPAIALRKE